MNTKRFPLVRGRKMRLTRLDGCGRPAWGDAATVVSEGFISVALTANTDEGEEINVKNAAGKTCIQDTPCPEFLGYGVEVTFCDVEPDAFALMTGQEPVYDANGDIVGFRMSSDVSACDSGFALEVWAGVPGQACSDDAASQGSFGYILLPFVQGGVVGDFTIENAAINFVVSGANTKRGSGWGVGPYDVVTIGGGVTGPLLKPIGEGDHLHVQYVEVAPPADTAGALPLLDPSDPPVTGVTVTVVGAVATATLTPAGVGDPCYIEWGDGTYTYFADDSGELAHIYQTTGTYTVVAHRGEDSATTTVTVSALGSTATGATAGTPGAFTPAIADVPADLTDMAGVVADPTTAWTVGQNVVLGDASLAHWSGSAWVVGAAT